MPLDHAVRKRGSCCQVPSICQVVCQVPVKYRGAGRDEKQRVPEPRSSGFTASSAILIPSLRLKREYYFASVAFVRTLPASVPANRNQRLFGHFILMRKMRKLRPVWRGLAMPGEA